MPENRFSCALVGAASFDADHFSAEHFDKAIAVDGGFSSLCAIGVTPISPWAILIRWGMFRRAFLLRGIPL